MTDEECLSFLWGEAINVLTNGQLARILIAQRREKRNRMSAARSCPLCLDKVPHDNASLCDLCYHGRHVGCSGPCTCRAYLSCGGSITTADYKKAYEGMKKLHEEAEADVTKLSKENTALRALVAKHTCVYDHNKNGSCELGYPGCACADDIAALAFDVDGAMKRMKKRYEDQIAALEKEIQDLGPFVQHIYDCYYFHHPYTTSECNCGLKDVAGKKKAHGG